MSLALSRSTVVSLMTDFMDGAVASHRYECGVEDTSQPNDMINGDDGARPARHAASMSQRSHFTITKNFHTSN